MSNHTHLVLFVDSEQAQEWSIEETIERWHGLFSGTALSQRFLQGETLLSVEFKQVEEIATQWKERLMSISWFMRCLNEHIARLANTEDGCSGRFWEGRFKCQALLDEAALAACLAYVDLNPIRSGIAETPEASDYTSVQRRIQALIKAKDAQSSQPPQLMPFVGNPRQDMPKGLTFRLKDYLNLIDWTGRLLRDDKRGVIAATQPPILQRLGIEAESWLSLTLGFEAHFTTLVGRPDDIRLVCESRGQSWAHGLGASRRLFGT
jgi:REP element-mobilizing transposase RayT